MTAPIPFSSRQSKAIFLRRVLPVVVWSFSALACAFLLGRQSSWKDFEGLAMAQDHEIAPIAVGVVESVGFSLFERVEAGDVLVRFKGEELEARLATQRAEFDRLEAEASALEMTLAENAVGVHSGWLADLRRFRMDEQRLRIETLGLALQLEEARMEIPRLQRSLAGSDEVLLAVSTADELARREHGRLEGLAASGEVSLSLLDEFKVRLLASRRARIEAATARDDFELALEQAKRRLEDTEALKQSAELDLQEARRNRDVFLARLPSVPKEDPRLVALDQTVRVQRFRIEEIMLARRALSLKAPVAGRVSQLAARMGQAVLAGEPVLILTEEHAGGVLAWLPDTDAALLGRLEEVLVARVSDPGNSHPVAIIRKGPAIAQLPPQLWRDPGLPLFGFPILLGRPEGLNLVPGERLLVQAKVN
jgi:multidrug resistance efflux pump